jgi:hypothetical protein
LGLTGAAWPRGLVLRGLNARAGTDCIRFLVLAPSDCRRRSGAVSVGAAALRKDEAAN